MRRGAAEKPCQDHDAPAGPGSSRGTQCPKQAAHRTRRLGAASWRKLATIAAAGTLAAGTGVLAADLLAPTAASASSNQVWTGSGDGSSWSDGMNWQSMSVPQNGDSVTIQPTASQPTAAKVVYP